MFVWTSVKVKDIQTLVARAGFPEHEGRSGSAFSGAPASPRTVLLACFFNSDATESEEGDKPTSHCDEL